MKFVVEMILKIPGSYLSYTRTDGMTHNIGRTDHRCLLCLTKNATTNDQTFLNGKVIYYMLVLVYAAFNRYIPTLPSCSWYAIDTFIVLPQWDANGGHEPRHPVSHITQT